MTGLPAESGWAGHADGAVARRSRRRLIAAGVGALAVAAAVFGVTRLIGGSGSPRAVNQTATTTATVQRTTLAQTTPINGTIGFASLAPAGPSPVSIVQPGGSPPSALDQAQQAVASAQQSLAADEQAAEDADAAAGQSVAQARQSLSSAQTTQAADSAQLDIQQATLAADQHRQAADCGGGATASGTSGPTGGSSGSSGACSADATQVAADQNTVAATRQKVASDQAATDSAQGQRAAAEQKAAQSGNENRAKLNADQLTLSRARSAAADAQTSETAYDQSSKYTALPVVGQVIEPGKPLWSVDGIPVGLLPGTLSPWRAFTPGMSPGSDVAALNQALVDVGDGAGMAASDAFSDATAAAIDRLQGSLGRPQTGTLPLGSVIFAPTAVRVTTVHPQVGAPVAAGAPVLDVTSTTPVVNVALPVDESYLVKVGDPVSVRLPDGTTTDGTITAVGTVATTPAPSPGATSSSPAATINVTVTMARATGAASLDQAPVTVNITNGTSANVLAVPTTALLPLAGGGYAVEMVAGDGTHHLVAVTIGIFDDQAGMVQVSGAGLAAGQRVVAAA